MQKKNKSINEMGIEKFKHFVQTGQIYFGGASFLSSWLFVVNAEYQTTTIVVQKQSILNVVIHACTMYRTYNTVLY